MTNQQAKWRAELRAARLRMKLTQQQMAEALGFTGGKVVLCRLERGHRAISKHLITTVRLLENSRKTR